MSFPSVASSSVGDSSSSILSLAPPSGIVAGELGIVFYRNGSGVTDPVMSGWTALVNAAPSADDDHIWIWYKKLTGSEAWDVTSTNFESAAIGLRVSGAQDCTVEAPYISSQTQAVSGSPNGASFSPSGGAKSYLWVYFLSMDGYDPPVSGDPPTTTDGDTFTGKLHAGKDVNGSGYVSLWTWTLAKNDDNIDPVAQSLSGSRRWDVFTVAIPPMPDLGPPSNAQYVGWLGQ